MSPVNSFTMRRIFSLFIILFFTCCEDGNMHEQYFNPEDFNLLDLAEIDGFWQDASIIDTSFQSAGGTIFGAYPGFLEGISLFDDSNAIRISVFKIKILLLMRWSLELKMWQF